MILIEIPANPNCEPVEMRVFHDVEPPRPVGQVRLERQIGHPEWYAVIGWTASKGPCPAFLQKVDDSGEGVAFLLYGGDAGIRLRPAEQEAPWRIGDPAQRGEPFVILSDLSDVRLLEEPAVRSS